MAKFFKSAWGSVELWISVIDTDEGRDLVIQKYISGNVPNVQNRGDKGRTARCELLFDDIIGQEEDGASRLDSMIALKDAGKPQLFVHPLRGSYLAEIEDFQYRIEATGTITGSASFIATEDGNDVVLDPIGQSLDVDAGAMQAAQDDLLSQLESSDPALLSQAKVPDVASKVNSLFQQATSAREVLVGLSDITERIGQEIDDLKLAADVALWPVMKAYVLLGEASRAAALAATGDVGDLMTLRVDSPTSWRRLMAEIYGGADAERYSSDNLSINDVPTPARIPTGTVLKLKQPKRAA